MEITNIEGKVLEKIKFKGAQIFSDKRLIKSVEKIIEDVMKNGDKALIKYARKFDKAPKNFSIKVSEEEVKEAINLVQSSKYLMEITSNFLKMSERVYKFHKAQFENLNLNKKWYIQTNGTVGQVITPIERVCIYVPGGRAIYPSTLIMNAIPAKVAGVKSIYLSTPSSSGKVSPVIIYLSKELGIKDIYKVGGAAAVSAFAFGTESIPKVDMIVGPGNKYFITAKKILNGIIGIDMLPGPSEIAVIADHGNPYNIALDILSQLEHDPDSSGYLVSTDKNLIENVKDSIKLILKETNKSNSLLKSTNNILFIHTETIEEGFKVINDISPEHLEVIVNGITTENIDKFVKNAGTVLIGETTPVVLTDYIAGTNHVLPTGTTARFSSPLGVYNFVKFYNFAQWSKENLNTDREIVSKLSRYEGLEIHALSLEKRIVE